MRRREPAAEGQSKRSTERKRRLAEDGNFRLRVLKGRDLPRCVRRAEGTVDLVDIIEDRAPRDPRRSSTAAGHAGLVRNEPSVVPFFEERRHAETTVADRQSVVEGKSVQVREDLGGSG